MTENLTTIALLSKSVRKESINEDIQFHASVCYQGDFKSAEDKACNIPTNALYEPGHHTPAEHTSLTFGIENIPISVVTLGLHLTHPFYNSDQRSFRYCLQDLQTSKTEQFISDWIDRYIKDESHGNALMSFVMKGIDFFAENIDSVTQDALVALEEERPNYQGDKLLQAKRLAQENFRCILSTILPTGLTHTIDLITLASMYQCAWNQPIADIMETMMTATIDEKDLNYLFKKRYTDVDMSWVMNIANTGTDFVNHPKASLVDDSIRDCHIKRFDKIHSPLDLLQFSPKARSSRIDHATMKVKLSMAAFGQDQRHRKLERSLPSITDTFLIPPLIQKNEKCVEFIKKYWIEFRELTNLIGIENTQYFLPYGAMVTYEKWGTVQSIFHEQNRRNCLNAQGEIATLASETLDKLKLKSVIGAPCQSGKCTEGKRFCGRDMKKPIERKLL